MGEDSGIEDDDATTRPQRRRPDDGATTTRQRRRRGDEEDTAETLPPRCCHRAAPNVATAKLPPSRSKCCHAVVASHDATTTRRRGSGDPHSRCRSQVPSQSLQPSPSVEPPRRPHSRCLAGALQRKQSLQFPGTVAAAPQRCSLCSPSSRCSPQMGSAPTVGALQQAVAASPRCPSQSPHRPRPSQSLQPHGRG